MKIIKISIWLILALSTTISYAQPLRDTSKIDSVDFYNDQVKIAFAKAELSDYRYHIYTNNHTILVYNLHHTLSLYIFILVTIIVLTGLVFSGIQFLITLKSVTKKLEHNRSLPLSNALASTEEKNTKDDQTAQTSSKTTLKFNKDGIEVTSSVLGVIILTMSIVFFYMYLHFVYPVVEVSKEVNTEQVNKK